MQSDKPQPRKTFTHSHAETAWQNEKKKWGNDPFILTYLIPA